MKRGEFKLADRFDEVVRYYEEGHSLAATGAAFGASEAAVRRLFRRFGIPIRTISQSQPFAWSDERRKDQATKLAGKPSGAAGKRWKYLTRLEKPWCLGESNPNWKGGTTTLIEAIRTDARYAEWRMGVYQRDQFRCVDCGRSRSRANPLNADHIVPLSYLLGKNQVVDIEAARSCAALWDIANGRTLCLPCHKRTDTWGQGALAYEEA